MFPQTGALSDIFASAIPWRKTKFQNWSGLVGNTVVHRVDLFFVDDADLLELTISCPGPGAAVPPAPARLRRFRRTIRAVTRVFDAPSARSRATSSRHQLGLTRL